MESMDVGEQGSLKERLPTLHLWYLNDNKGIVRTTLQEIDLKEISIRSLKEIAVKSDECFTTFTAEIDILHNGVVLEELEGLSLEALNVRPNTVLHVVKKLGTISKEKDEGSKKGFRNEPKKVISTGKIAELAIALKTMILSPAFITTIEKLSDPQMLRNIIAVVPNLQFDPVGIAIIQDPSMILYLADEESLKALSETRPWVVEAFSFISATVHQQEATSSRGGTAGNRNASGLNSLLSYFRQSMDDDGEEDEEGASGGQQQGSSQQTITRQQLVAALESFNNLRGGLNLPPSQGQTGNVPSSRPTSTTQPRMDPLSLLGNSPRELRNEPVASTPRNDPAQPPPLTGELVARAMREALSQLPPEQRNAQMNAFRNLAMSLNQSQQQAPPATQPPSGLVSPSNTTRPTTASGTEQYRAEIAQMRDLGITDENLSIMALRVSDGDVATAVELIFSGWSGEGFE